MDEDDIYSAGVEGVHEGVLFVADKPQWIVNQFTQSNQQFITCYNIKKSSLKHYQNKKTGGDINVLRKDYTIKEIEDTKFSSAKTALAKLAQSRYTKKEPLGILEQDEDPVFSTVLMMGTDTFTGQYGLGFYEHEPSTTKIFNGETNYILGPPTNVFLSIDRIAWTSHTIPKPALLDSLRAQGQSVYASLLFIDFNNQAGGNIEF